MPEHTSPILISFDEIDQTTHTIILDEELDWRCIIPNHKVEEYNTWYESASNDEYPDYVRIVKEDASLLDGYMI